MITKTLSGIPILDETHGGVYSGRSFMVSGRTGTGKSMLAFQFVRQGLEQDEPCLILTTMAASDLAILAEAMGFSFALDIDSGKLTLLEYQSFIPGASQPEKNYMPPEGFLQLREIIETHAIKRMVLDTVLPWVTVPGGDNLAEHTFSFVRSCDRLGVTTLMTLPKPVSALAIRLKRTLEDVVPVSVLLAPTEDEDIYSWQITKYLGEKRMVAPGRYSIRSGRGIVPCEDESTLETRSHQDSPAPGQPVRFSKAMPFNKSPDSSPRETPQGGRSGSAQGTPPRLSNVWQPQATGKADADK